MDELGTLRNQLRALTERQRHLELIEAVAAAANLHDDPADAFREALNHVGDFAGWPIGHVFMFPDGETDGRLISARLWRGADSEQFADFRRFLEEKAFRPGVGLPGRVLATGKPVLLIDVTQERDFPRRDLCLACGLRGAFAFPAMIGEKVGAVLEFFIDRPAEPDDLFLQTLEQVGVHLGRAVERYRTVYQARRHNEVLATLLEDAEAQRRLAEAASQAKSRFLAVTSHEVRTPLNAVLGLSEAMKREPLTPHQRELNDGVLASGQTLMRLLNAVLDLSKVESGDAQAQTAPVDLAGLVASVRRLWQSQAEAVGVAVETDLDGLSPGAVLTDAGRIEQTLINLVSNAIKFTPPGGRVLIRAATQGAEARLEVIDDGPGPPPDDLERIFQPYEQTELGREAGGAGLGLAICAGNMALLQGRIGADRSPCGRSRFWMQWPTESCQATPDLEIAPEPLAPRRGLRILAAEDHPANRQVLSVILAPFDVALSFALNGREAADMAAAGDFDLILMDASMPVLDGVGALAEIRGLSGGRALTPVHMLTANAFPEDVARYLAAGADGVLTKPIDMPALLGLLASVSQGPTAQDAA